MFDRGFIRSVNFNRVVPAETQPAQMLVRERLDELQELRARSEKMFAHVGAGGNHELLVFAVNHFAHALDQQAFRVALENGIPLRAPQNFDHVPARAAKFGFEFLNDLPVAAYRAVQALQVAIHDEN